MERKPRRSKKEVRELTRQALTLIDSGFATGEALKKVNITGAVFYRNRKKVKPRKNAPVMDSVAIKPQVKSEADLLKELVKDFLYQRFLENGGIK